MANYWRSTNRQFLFACMPDLLDRWRTTYVPHSGLGGDDCFQQVRNADILILDDFDICYVTSWVRQKTYQLINYRYNARLATVISVSNMTHIDPRVRSRLQDMRLVRYVRTAVSGRRGRYDVGHLHPTKTFQTFSLRSDLPILLADNLRLAYETAQHYDFAGWLVISGVNSGSGKTHLAAAVAHRALSCGQDVMFVNVSGWLEHLRELARSGGNDSYYMLLERCKRVQFLVMDDLPQHGSKWVREKLFQVLNYRYEARLATVITTRAAIVELHPRLLSRLVNIHPCTIFILDAPGYDHSCKFWR